MYRPVPVWLWFSAVALLQALLPLRACHADSVTVLNSTSTLCQSAADPTVTLTVQWNSSTSSVGCGQPVSCVLSFPAIAASFNLTLSSSAASTWTFTLPAPSSAVSQGRDLVGRPVFSGALSCGLCGAPLAAPQLAYSATANYNYYSSALLLPALSNSTAAVPFPCFITVTSLYTGYIVLGMYTVGSSTVPYTYAPCSVGSSATWTVDSSLVSGVNASAPLTCRGTATFVSSGITLQNSQQFDVNASSPAYTVVAPLPYLYSISTLIWPVSACTHQQWGAVYLFSPTQPGQSLQGLPVSALCCFTQGANGIIVNPALCPSSSSSSSSSTSSSWSSSVSSSPSSSSLSSAAAFACNSSACSAPSSTSAPAPSVPSSAVSPSSASTAVTGTLVSSTSSTQSAASTGAAQSSSSSSGLAAATSAAPSSGPHTAASPSSSPPASSTTSAPALTAPTAQSAGSTAAAALSSSMALTSQGEPITASAAARGCLSWTWAGLLAAVLAVAGGCVTTSALDAM